MTGFQDFTPRAPLVLVGAGKMGGALLHGWLDRGLDPAAALAVDPAPPDDSREMLTKARVALVTAPPTGTSARVVVVAVKPQIIATVLPALRPLVGPETLIVSIAAGTPLARLAAGIGDAAIVRAMPNTPAQIGRGVTGAIASAKVTPQQRALADTLLSAVGDVVWVDDEALMDAVTAVSGSGPAYVFLLAECLADAAVAAGVPRDIAHRLARATVTGSAELLQQSQLTPAKLRENVTSPNGTTAAALAVLMAPGGLAQLMEKAVTAAARRSSELAG